MPRVGLSDQDASIIEAEKTLFPKGIQEYDIHKEMKKLCE